jgi:prepilin-type N-terminal cleavage/methylation domain-containing protein
MPSHSVRRRAPDRPGFTLVEMLVATAVSMILMWILSEAFVRGLGMFRTLRAQVNLQERLRMAQSMLRHDLASEHFIRETNAAPFRDYVSDFRFNRGDAPPTQNSGGGGGYFRIFQSSMDPSNPTGEPAVLEGTDPDGIAFTRSVSSMLMFTARRRPTGPHDRFQIQTLDPQLLTQTQPVDFQQIGYYSSEWAELAYFMVNTGDTANGTPLYDLCRRQRLLIPQNGPANLPAVSNPNPEEMSYRTQIDVGVNPPGNFYNRMVTVTQPRNRLGMMPAMTTRNFPPPVHPATEALAGLPGFVTGPNGAPPPVFAATQFFDPIDGRPRIRNLGEEAGVNRQGDDLLLTDVISFEVKALWDYDQTWMPSNTQAQRTQRQQMEQQLAPRLTYLGGIVNPDWPYDYLPLSPVVQPAGGNTNFRMGNMALRNRGYRVFDTWSSANPYGGWNTTTPNGNPAATANRIPLRIRLKAVTIVIRVWDRKTEQTRQVKIVQDL